MPREDTLIDVQALHHTYKGQDGGAIEALRGVDLQLYPGEFVALVGANGSGKTTLARHLNALLLPTRGEVHVGCLSTRDRRVWPQIRSQVAMVFQRPEDQIVATTVADDVAFGPQNLGLSGEEIARRVRWALEKVEMWTLRQRPPHLLSAGQQQRVAIAGALAMRPRCLVLDEASAMLDPAGKRALRALLGQLYAGGMTLLLVTHDMTEVALAERVIALAPKGGRVAFDGPPQALFGARERLSDLGLSPPPLDALAARLAQHWPDLSPGPWSVEQLAQEILAHLPTGYVPAFPRQSLRGRPTHPDPDPPIQVQDLHYTYLAGTPLATRALQGINLTVNAGEVLALLGPTGSGKSTLLQIVAGLLPPDPSDGQIIVAGQALDGTGFQPQAGRYPVGMLFQKSEQQLFETYVGDDVAYGPRQLGLQGVALRERVAWAMARARLPFEAFKDRFTQSLSGGERRKAALAGVLALQPHILLLDEPTAGLDPQARRALLETLQHLNRQEGVTLVFATHEMEDLAVLTSPNGAGGGRALLLQEGQVLAEGHPGELFEAHQDLEPPTVVALGRRLRALGLSFPLDALSIKDALIALTGGAS